MNPNQNQNHGWSSQHRTGVPYISPTNLQTSNGLLPLRTDTLLMPPINRFSSQASIPQPSTSVTNVTCLQCATWKELLGNSLQRNQDLLQHNDYLLKQNLYLFQQHSNDVQSPNDVQSLNFNSQRQHRYSPYPSSSRPSSTVAHAKANPQVIKTVDELVQKYAGRTENGERLSGKLNFTAEAIKRMYVKLRNNHDVDSDFQRSMQILRAQYRIDNRISRSNSVPKEQDRILFDLDRDIRALRNLEKTTTTGLSA